MNYKNIKTAIFVDRPNRFIAHVELYGKIETVHVKNTGRCRELLLPGVKVILEESDKPERKTRYDLIAVYKANFGLINIDSQAPNRVAKEWLSAQNFTKIIPEYTYGESRLDFYMEKGEEKYLMEIKGCTLEVDGVGYFPDAPTERGVRHIHELIKAKSEGYHAMLGFVIQMENVHEVRPNITTHPEFGVAMAEAKAAGVEVVFIECKVKEDALIFK